MGIDSLTTVTALAAGDLVPLFSQAGGEDQKASLTVLAAFLESLMTTGTLTRQGSAPSATGFSVSVTLSNTWLVLTPLAGYAAGTIVLPATVAAGEEVLVNCTQAVTTLTVDGNGHTVTGAPTTLAANAFFRLRYDDLTDSWFRVG